jgi:nucleoside-diphosphate-sugar epimerase
MSGGCVLIAGCGYVGTELGRRLASDGRRVFGLRRDASQLPPEIAPVKADLTQAATLEGLPEGITEVVYAASAGGRTDEAYAQAYVEGPANLLRALERRGEPVRRFLFTSSTAVYGQTDGSFVDEESVTEPESFTGRRVLEGERVVRSGPVSGVVLRLAGIYGPGRTRLIRNVWEGKARRPATPRYTNRIHRDDCAGALAHLLAIEPEHDLYLGVDREPAEVSTVVTWLAEQVGVPKPPPAEPEEEDGSLRRGRSNKRCRGERLRASGYELAYPTFRQGYAPIIREFLRDEGAPA